MNIKDLLTPERILKTIPVFLLVIAIFNSYYIVIEGHVGVVKRFGGSKRSRKPRPTFQNPLY